MDLRPKYVLLALIFAIVLPFGQARADSSVDPCALPSGSSYTLDPDGRTSLATERSPAQEEAFKSEIQTTCQHLRGQVEEVRKQPPSASCANYMDPVPDLIAQSYSIWDPRRCLSSASVMNFKHAPAAT